MRKGPATVEDVLKEIYRFSNNLGTDYLYVKIMGSNLKPDVTGGQKYEVNLGKSGVSLNKTLIESGLVESGNVMVDHFQFVQSSSEAVKIEEFINDSFSDKTQDMPDFKFIASDIYETDENARLFLEEVSSFVLQQF